MKNQPARMEASRSSALIRTLGSAALAGLGLSLGLTGESMGYFAFLFFALGALVFALQLVPGAAYLQLDDEGFEFASLFRRFRVQWTEVAAWDLMDVSTRGLARLRVVRWRYVEGRSPSGPFGAFSQSYGMKPEALRELMESRWRSALGHPH